MRKQKGEKADLADERIAKMFLKEVILTGIREAQAKNPLLGLALGAAFNLTEFEQSLDEAIDESVEMWNQVPAKHRRSIMELAIGILK